VNRFDAYITDYLNENKEVALEKIGIIKTAGYSSQDNQAASIEFTCNKKVSTSEGLINYIAEKAAKNRHLIFSDLESHFAQAREFINIGKSYEIPQVGFIKANKTGVYEFLPYSEVNKPVRTTTQPAKQHKRNADRSIVQLITFLIVIAILSGLGWQAYRFFSESKKNNTIQPITNNTDTAEIVPARDTTKTADTTSIASNKPVSYSPTDTANVRYIFETTASGLRARTRTAQLQSFGNNASYDSFVTNSTKFYNLYIIKPTKISDTLTVKDSIAKYLQKDIKLQIEPPK
jgi:hypothetical protein